MNKINLKELNTAFIATFSQGLFATLTFSTYLVHSPILFEQIKMSETEFSIGFVLFGLFNVLTNQLTTRFLLPKMGSTNCLILARLIYAFIPFLIFYFSFYNIFLLLSICWGISIGIQAPNIFTQVAIIEEKTKKILNPVFKSFSNSFYIFNSRRSDSCVFNKQNIIFFR